MKPVHYPLLFLVLLLWGLTFVAGKVSLQYFPPFMFLGVRLLIASALVVPFFRKPPIPWRSLLIITFVFGICHFSTMYISFHLGISASVAVIADQLRVPFSVILGALFLQDKLRWRSLLGIAMSMGGTLLLVGTPEVSSVWLPFVIFIVSAFFWAIYSLLLKSYGKINGVALLGWIALLSFPCHLLLSLLFEENQWQVITTAPLSAWAGLFYIAIVATIISHGLWYFLVSEYPISQVVPYTLLVPVFGIGSSYLLLGETLSSKMIMGSLVMMAGVAIVVIRRPYAAKEGDGA